jgi:hypothetical protein
MPDWCFNNLVVCGDTRQLEELREAVAGSGGALDFERGAHWGCSRPADPDSIRLEDTDDEALSFRLSTPWTPPGRIAASLAARFPALDFGLAFFHPARGFAGVIAYEGGVEVSREESEEPVAVRALLERKFGPAEAAELLDPED